MYLIEIKSIETLKGLSTKTNRKQLREIYRVLNGTCPRTVHNSRAILREGIMEMLSGLNKSRKVIRQVARDLREQGDVIVVPVETMLEFGLIETLKHII